MAQVGCQVASSSSVRLSSLWGREGGQIGNSILPCKWKLPEHSSAPKDPEALLFSHFFFVCLFSLESSFNDLSLIFQSIHYSSFYKTDVSLYTYLEILTLGP